VQSDEEALAFLHGLPIIPVQRNRGMDAILKAKPGENPILIRVRRRGESLADAAELLHSAGQSKQPATLMAINSFSESLTCPISAIIRLKPQLHVAFNSVTPSAMSSN
jgi:hypothetical protein